MVFTKEEAIRKAEDYEIPVSFDPAKNYERKYQFYIAPSLPTDLFKAYTAPKMSLKKLNEYWGPSWRPKFRNGSPEEVRVRLVMSNRDEEEVSRGYLYKDSGIFALAEVGRLGEGIYNYGKDPKRTYPIAIDDGKRLVSIEMISLHENFHCLDHLLGLFKIGVEFANEQNLDEPLKRIVVEALESLEWDPAKGVEGTRFSEQLGARAGLTLLSNSRLLEEKVTQELMDNLLDMLAKRSRDSPSKVRPFHYLPSGALHSYNTADLRSSRQPPVIHQFLQAIELRPSIPVFLVWSELGYWRGLYLRLQPTPVFSFFWSPLNDPAPAIQSIQASLIVFLILKAVGKQPYELVYEPDLVPISPQVGANEGGLRIFDAIRSFQIGTPPSPTNESSKMRVQILATLLGKEDSLPVVKRAARDEMQLDSELSLVKPTELEHARFIVLLNAAQRKYEAARRDAAHS